MAVVRSLGHHEPSALSYLIAESILPSEPHPSLYKWQCSQALADDRISLVDEEILTTGSCVVWSRCGMIRRVLNLDIEDESILQAFTTHLLRRDETNARPDSLTQGKVYHEHALVVILRSQALIYFLSGDNHILPLSFEVESAFPCPYGFLLQRKIVQDEASPAESTSTTHDLSTISESLGTIKGSSQRPSLVLPSASNLPRPSHRKSLDVPRTYSLSETMSELALVVQGSYARPQTLSNCTPLPLREKLLYVSSRDELASIQDDHDQLCVALTVDATNSNLTIWHVAQEPPAPIDRSTLSSQHNNKLHISKRKSSNVYGRADTTASAASRAPATFRESFGAPAQSYSVAVPRSAPNEQHSFAADDIVTQLGAEFGEVGVQTRSQRRVSSMLARTDLVAGNDHATFNDLAAGHGNRKSLNRAARRGESVGSFNERQSFGIRRRSSFATNVSVYSNTTSFLGIPGQPKFDDLDDNFVPGGLEGDNWDEAEGRLPRELGLFKLKTVTRSERAFKSSCSQPFKVMTLLSPNPSHTINDIRRELSICIMDSDLHQILVVTILVKLSTAAAHGAIHGRLRYQLKATNVHRGANIADATTVSTSSLQRLLLLARGRGRTTSIQLEAPWTSSFPLVLPSSYALYSPFWTQQVASPSQRRDTGIRRTVPASVLDIAGVDVAGSHGEFFVSDKAGDRYLLSTKLLPTSLFVRRVLAMSNVVLGADCCDSLLLAFWEVSTWLKQKDTLPLSESTVLRVVLFMLAVPFLDDQQRTFMSPVRKKGSSLRSSSGSVVDLSNWNDMLQLDTDHPVNTSRNTCWAWLAQPKSMVLSPKSSSKRHRSQDQQVSNESAPASGNTSILDCIAWAKDFVETPAGETAIGPEGYLPTATNKSRGTRENALAKVLIGVHLICEELKLDTTTNMDADFSTESVYAVLAQLGQWLGWQDWTFNAGGYYGTTSTSNIKWIIDNGTIAGLNVPVQPFHPPSIFEYIANSIAGGPVSTFPTLDFIADESRKKVSESGHRSEIVNLTPRTFTLLAFMDSIRGANANTSLFKNPLPQEMDPKIVKDLPDGIAAVFHQMFASQQMRSSLNSSQAKEPFNGMHYSYTHDANKDYHTISVAALEADSLQRWDASSEADRHVITRLIFNEDRRLQEASRLVNQTRPPIVECTPEPEWSEADLLEAQKEIAQYVTRRTLSVAAGRGLIHFSARVPLLTERVPIPAFSLQCVMKPRHVSESMQAMTFSADKAAFTEDKVCWAFFHNGVSAGLMVSRDAHWIDTSWILYNKPPDLTNRHAGFLLALGLNGHLRSLAKWVAFKYLTPKHTMTSIGLLLGLSVSYLGTMDTLITRLLSVHVTRLLPPGAAELNLSPLTQTTGIIGIGLLYLSSQHRRMSEVMLSEIENSDAEEGAPEDALLRDEGYRLAAGFSLGLINLGQGKHIYGLHDVGVLERLLTLAIGTKNVNFVHVLDRATAGAVMAVALLFMKTNDEAVARKIDIPDTVHQFDYVRPDIFLLRTLARHIIMWDSVTADLAFVTSSLPGPYRRRAALTNTKALDSDDLPFFNIIAGICFAIGLRYAGSQQHTARDLLVAYLDQFIRISRLPAINYNAKVTLNSVRNCLDVVALAAATVMAGSGDLVVMRRLRALHGRTDKDTPFGSHVAAHMALGALFLAGGTCTFGTSNIATAALCIAFYPLFPNDVLDNRSHLQALRHLWVLAVEGRCLVARSADNGSVIGGIEGIIYFNNSDASQTMRAPGLLPDFSLISRIKIYGEGYWPATIDLTAPKTKAQVLKDQAVNVSMHRRATYHKPPHSDALIAEFEALEEENVSGIPSVNPNVATRMSQQLQQTSPAGGVQNSASSGQGNPFEWIFGLSSFRDYDYAERALVLNHNPPPSSTIEADERGRFGTTAGFLAGTPIDSRLEFERGILPDNDRPGLPGSGNVIQRDKLWQLRLLFAWADRWDADDDGDDNDNDNDTGGKSATRQQQRTSMLRDAAERGFKDEDVDGLSKWNQGTWLRREVIDRLRDRVWTMMSSADRGAQGAGAGGPSDDEADDDNNQ